MMRKNLRERSDYNLSKKIDLFKWLKYYTTLLVYRMSQATEIETITQEIYNQDCPNLDIGDRVGITGYIDFIDTSEFEESFNKGIDKYERKFVSFRANIEYEDGTTKETFTTLFQRYSKTENLWMGAGRNTHLFDTDGGTNLQQLQLVLKLLKEGSVDITDEIYENCRITPSKWNWDIDNNKPKRIYLVSKVEELKHKTNDELKDFDLKVETKESLEDVMRDLEEKVNPKSVTEGITKLVTAIQTNDPAILLNPMERGAKEFEERVGRPMTYSEMRAMWG